MVKPSVALVADDFTGANDSAGRFASAGWNCWVALDQAPPPQPADFTGVNARSRYLDAAAAGRASASAWRKMPQAAWWYQKIDSTLRGFPGREVLGLLAEKHPRFIAFCPAYPRHGRTVENGRLKVHGRPLMATEYAADPLSPAATGEVLKLFPRGLAMRVPLLVVRRGQGAVSAFMRRALAGARPPRIFAFDCTSEAQLTQIARACLSLGGRAFAGASGLAGALAATQSLKLSNPRWQAPSRALVLAGSVSQTSLEQAAVAEERGALWSSVDWEGGGLKAGASRLAAWNKALAGPGLVLSALKDRAAIDRKSPAATGELRLRRLAAAALALGAARGRLACQLTGGHTAEVFYAAAGLEGNWIQGELQPGLPFGQALGAGGKAWVATKPGGFGGADTFARFLQKGWRKRGWQAS